jgi:hypothetical protein
MEQTLADHLLEILSRQPDARPETVTREQRSIFAALAATGLPRVIESMTNPILSDNILITSGFPSTRERFIAVKSIAAYFDMLDPKSALSAKYKQIVESAGAWPIRDPAQLSKTDHTRYKNWPDLVAIRESRRPLFAGYVDYKRINSTEARRFVISCLWTMVPPARNDYLWMRWTETSPTDSVCDLENRVFIHRRYKTMRSPEFGNREMRVPIPPDLHAVLSQWRTICSWDYIISAHDDKAARTMLNDNLRVIFGCPVRLIRKSYVTYRRACRISPEEEIIDAKHMMHSLATHRAAYELRWVGSDAPAGKNESDSD